MKISVKMTRAENMSRFGAGPVSLDLEEYLCGVVPAEVYESSHMEALKAQAVAARTFAAKRAMSGTVVDDTPPLSGVPRRPYGYLSAQQAGRGGNSRAGACLWRSACGLLLFRFQRRHYQAKRRGLEPGLSLLCEQT